MTNEAMTRSAITFDFHNTLVACSDWFQLEVHSLVSSFLRWRAAERAESLDPALSIAADRAYRSLRSSIHDHGHELDAERSVATILDQLEIASTTKEIERGIAILMRQTLETAAPVPGAKETIQQLAVSGVRLGVVSSAVYHPFLLWALDQFGMLPAFGQVTTSASSGFYKSRPEIFWHTLDRLSADPNHSIHVGDSFRFDVEGARRAGMLTVWLDGESSQPAGTTNPELHITTLVDATPKLLTLLPGRIDSRSPSDVSLGS
jgi:FMN phosphatase YigB (HAD superfamily)